MQDRTSYRIPIDVSNYEDEDNESSQEEPSPYLSKKTKTKSKERNTNPPKDSKSPKNKLQRHSEPNLKGRRRKTTGDPRVPPLIRRRSELRRNKRSSKCDIHSPRSPTRVPPVPTKRKSSLKLPRTPSPRSRVYNIDLRTPRHSPGRAKGEGVLNVKYLKEIGRGGSGTVLWKASIDGWKCCVKELPLEHCNSFDTEIFENEIKILSKLPREGLNFVRYLGFQRTLTKYQLFMTLYDGTLNDLIRYLKNTSQYFTIKHIIRLGCHVLQALSVLHSRRLMHRDIKSMNILFEGDKKDMDNITFILGDFGEAKIISQSQKANTVVGSNLWMAPEVMTATKLDEYSFEADVWSFGMVMYEMMTLNVPYHGIKGFGASKRIIQGELPVLTNDEIQRYADIMPLWEMCLSFHPIKRPTAGQALMHIQVLKDYFDKKIN